MLCEPADLGFEPAHRVDRFLHRDRLFRRALRDLLGHARKPSRWVRAYSYSAPVLRTI